MLDLMIPYLLFTLNIASIFDITTEADYLCVCVVEGGGGGGGAE